MRDPHCPRCGATLPGDEDEVLCPSCGYAVGAKTEAIEVSPDELLAELARRSRMTGVQLEVEGDLESEMSAITTTPSGLLKGPASLSAPAPAPAPPAERARRGVVVAVVVAVLVLGAFVWLTWDLLP